MNGRRSPIIYSPLARRLHWITAALVLIQIPVGLYMVYRGSDLNLWDGLTNFLYSTHKLFGVLIFIVVSMRLANIFLSGSPPPEPTIEPWQRVVSKLVHWTMYVLLVLLPVLGYLGISYYPAFDVFNFFYPNIFGVEADQDKAARIFLIHRRLGILLAVLVGLHIAATLYHYFVRKDDVLGRMWPRFLRSRGN